ncbi:MAG TPA: alpha/beta fold hydrolase [Candidatus Elarobacter sp.]
MLALTSGAAAQMTYPVSPNAILPNPPPTASLTAWVEAPGRTMLSIDAEGATLRGWSYAGSTPAMPTVLYFGGNAARLVDEESSLRAIAARGPSVVAFDYRGYGFSTGQADVMTMRRDALKLFDATAARAGGSGRVIVFGFSLGTVMAAYIASQRKVGGVALVASIADATEEIPAYAKASGMSFPGVTLVATPDATEAFGEAALIAQSNAPLLVVHGELDSTVPVAQGREVYAASKVTAKRLVVIPGVGHNGTLAAPATLDALIQLASSVLPAAR